MPFHGDQAWFAYAGEQVASGAVLYRDVWGPKQPGIFVFYGVAGSLFGFDEFGIHLFEALYWIAFSIVAVGLLRDRFRSQWALASVPLLTVGAYYAAVTTPSQLTQAESLAGFPIFLTLWFAVGRLDGFHSRRLFLAGLFGGVVLLFKLLFFPLVASIWLLGGWARLRPKSPDSGMDGSIAGASLSLLAGAAVPWIPVVGYFIVNDVVDLAVWTYFEYPFEASSTAARSVARLARSAAWFGTLFAPLVLLSILAWRADRPPRTTNLYHGLVVWLGVGLLLVLVQLWWSYHLFLLLVPLGVLAAFGLDRLLSGTPSPWRSGRVLAGALLFVPLVLSLGLTGVRLASHSFALSQPDRSHYQAEVWSRYGDLASVEADAVFLRQEAEPGPIYVFGDPNYMLRSGRTSASSVLGWGPEQWPPRLWDVVEHDLTAKPPAYVFVQNWAASLIIERSPRIQSLLGLRYRPIRETPNGTWYALDGHGHTAD